MGRRRILGIVDFGGRLRDAADLQKDVDWRKERFGHFDRELAKVVRVLLAAVIRILGEALQVNVVDRDLPNGVGFEKNEAGQG